MNKAFSFITLGAVIVATAAAKNAKWTYYWLCFESEESGSGSKNTWLKTCSGKNIAKVTNHYA